MSSKIMVEILVTRTTSNGRVSKARATVEGSVATSGLGERWLAEKVGHKTLKVLAENYENVSKHLDDETSEPRQE